MRDNFPRRSRSASAIHLNAGAETVAIAALSTQRDRQPVKLAATIEIELRSVAQRSSDDIHPAVVVQITERRAAAGHGQIRSRVGSFETACTVQGQQGRFAVAQRIIVGLDVVEDMSLDNKGVFPSVVVKIFQSDSPARHVAREDAKTCFQFLRAEQSLAVVMKQNVGIVRKLGDKKV